MKSTTIQTDQKLSKSFLFPALITGILLLIPLIAMQFTDEVIWTLSDFIFAGLLLYSTGVAYKLLTRKSADMIHRIAFGFALFTGLFLIWVNLAVGIIGSENNVINLIYFGVIFVGAAGALLARFRLSGMIYTMFAMAAVQGLIAVIALFTGMQELPESSVIEILAVNGFFISLFVISGLLFRYASLEGTVGELKTIK